MPSHDGFFYPTNLDLTLTPELGVKCPTCSAPPRAACRQQGQTGFYTIRAHTSRVNAQKEK